MTVALFALYLVSHAIGFAGFGIMVFVSVYEKDARDVRYLAFLLGFFAYVALGNVAFIRSSFLGVREYFLEPWFFPSFMSVTAVVMAAYSAMFHGLPKEEKNRRGLAALIAFSCVPLALLAAGYAPFPPGTIGGVRVGLMRGASVALAALLALSIAFMARNVDNAVDGECAAMMRFTIWANSIFIPPFLAETWYNFGATRPFIPVSVESVYYLALGIANVGYLARGVLIKRRADGAREIKARGERARAALSKRALSDRERGILEYLTLGLGNKQIAARLDMTEYTVRNAVSTLLRKTGARNRVELVELYRKERLR